MILAKDLKMVSQLIDSAGQQGNLNVGTTGVFLMKPKCRQIDVITRGHNFKESRT